MKPKAVIIICLSISVLCCGQNENTAQKALQPPNGKTLHGQIDSAGNTISSRFPLPKGYERILLPANSFGQFLRTLPLKPPGSKVRRYDGRIKQNEVYEAVVDMDIGDRDLQQCADAVIRLRAEYLFKQKAYDKISFDFTSGFPCAYKEWMKGNRISVRGNEAQWYPSAASSNTYKDFRDYLDIVFNYAGTLSLSKQLKVKDISEITVGDVFIKGGSPGHAVIVVDVARDKSGAKIFMLAQSYMPAQDIQVLKNLNDPLISPWYKAGFSGDLDTPEWTFGHTSLKSFE